MSSITVRIPVEHLDSSDDYPDDLIEGCCEAMHDAYERAAVIAGWKTQEASRKPWADVPEANKQTMRYAVASLIDHLVEETSND